MEVKMKIIKKAKIKLIAFSDLKVNDEVLWSNSRYRIDEIDKRVDKIHIINDANKATPKICLNSYSKIYKLKKYKEINICNICGKEIEDGLDTCPKKK